MSNYTKTVNFATKDNLSPGNPLKIVKGTEIDTEYNNIATAVATKTDGAASSTDNAIARFDSTTGKIIQNSVVTIDDTTGDIVGTATQGVFNTVSTTVNAFGAATTLNLGAATGTATVANTTLAAKAITASTTLAVTGTSTLTGAVTATAGVTGPITSSSVAITGGSITGITDLAVADGGTGASTAAGGLNNLLPSQTGNANKYLQTDGTNATWDAVSLSTADITGTLGVANGGTGVTTSTGTTNVVLSNSPTLVTPALGTPSAAVLTNATGLPISTGVSGLGTGVATLLATPSSANLASAITDETGSGALVFATSPTLVTPILGTPTSGTLTNATGLPISTGVSGLGTGVATFLATPSSANLLSALTDETGTGSAVFATSPTLVTPILGTPTSGTATNLTGLPLTTGVTGLLPVANGGTATATPSIVAGSNVTVTGTWPNQTIASTSSGGVSYTAVKTANYTAANNDGVLTNTTGGAFTVTLPTSPSVGNIVLVIDSLSQWGTNNLTVDPTALIKIAGNTAGDTLVCDITGATVTLVYTGATYGWNVAAQVGGNGGTAVTLTGTQTLTNKTLTAPVLTTPTLGVATGTSFQGIIGNVTPAAGTFTTVTASTTGEVATFTTTQTSGNAVTINVDGSSGTPVGLRIAAGFGTIGSTAKLINVVDSAGGNLFNAQASGVIGVGSGIAFPATQSASANANTLDDYEEGTWTPTLGGTATYSFQGGSYTKIGRLVTAQGFLVVSSIGTGATNNVSGLPFTCISQTVGIGGSVGYFENLNNTVVFIQPEVQPSGTTIVFNTLAAAGGTTSYNLSIWKSTTRLSFVNTYFV